MSLTFMTAITYADRYQWASSEGMTPLPRCSPARQPLAAKPVLLPNG